MRNAILKMIMASIFASVPVVMFASAHLTVDKETTTPSVTLDADGYGVATYTVKITNTGTIDLEKVAMKDVLPSGFSWDFVDPQDSYSGGTVVSSAKSFGGFTTMEWGSYWNIPIGGSVKTTYSVNLGQADVVPAGTYNNTVSVSVLVDNNVLTFTDDGTQEHDEDVIVTPSVDADNDGLSDGQDLDSDNDGILDSIEKAFIYDFESSNEHWSVNAIMEGRAFDKVAYTSEATTTAGCTMPTILQQSPDGTAIMADNNISGTAYIVSSGSEQGDLSPAMGGKLTFWYLNATYDGNGTQDINLMKHVQIFSKNTMVQTTFNVDGMTNSGWHKVSIDLTEQRWNTGGNTLATVLADYQQIGIEVSAIEGKSLTDGTTACVNSEYYAIDSVSFSSVYKDTDGDGVEDYLDLDSDNDGIADIVEAGGVDSDNDGHVDGFTDTDQDGLADSIELLNGEDHGLYAPRSDSDILADYLDLDSDGDLIPDAIEAQPTSTYSGNDGNVSDAVGTDGVASYGLRTPQNTDGDALPDYRDQDSDNDTLSDFYESGLSDTGDMNEVNYSDPDGTINLPKSTLLNEIGDTTEVAYREVTDTDGDGVLDTIDEDDDNDGIFDVDEGSLSGNSFLGGDWQEDNSTHTMTDIFNKNTMNANTITVTANDTGVVGTAVNDNSHASTTSLTYYKSSGNKKQFLLMGDYEEGVIKTKTIRYTIRLEKPVKNFKFYTQGFTNRSYLKTIVGNFSLAPDSVTVSPGAEFVWDGSSAYAKLNKATDASGPIFTFNSPLKELSFDVTTEVNMLGDNGTKYRPFGVTWILAQTLISTDMDNDGIANYLDLDSDNDGIPDNIEAQSTAAYVGNDGDVHDDINATTGAWAHYIPVDTDNDGIKDFLDTDSDNDGILDKVESGLTFSPLSADLADANSDGADDSFAMSFNDPNGNANDPTTAYANQVGDTSEVAYREIDDFDNDGIPDIM